MSALRPTATTRPLPATARGQRARAQIVDAAATLMYHNGVSTTSLDDVLAAAGAGKGQMYHYFDGKADLVAAVIERQLELVLAAQQPELDHTDSWQGIKAWMARILREQSRAGGPFGCPLGTIAAELKNDETFRPSLDAAFARWEAPLARGLKAMKNRGELGRAAKPARLAAMVVAALQGGMLLARVRGDVTVLRDTLDGVMTELRRWAATPAPVEPGAARRGRQTR
ncbi:TetR/AcrR family transcriptional regulator [Mycolicibacterium cosmeticum]|uniref:TetR/AcrR family transcriptional regulator n=1 Tax=Mycolicibacterium cosmeticum TaxID=258533 RepID=UPI003204BF7C